MHLTPADEPKDTVLPRGHRVTASRDFRAVARRGARAGGAAVVVSVLLRPAPRGDEAAASHRPDQHQQPQRHWRCGLIVSKAVGNAVLRHRTARRLRHIIFEMLREEPALIPAQSRADIVIRALPAVVGTEHAELCDQVRSGLRRSITKAVRKQQAQRDGREQHMRPPQAAQTQAGQSHDRAS